jgi:hypothetical protein
MDYRYRIEPSYGLIIDKFDGQLTLDDLFGSLKKCASDPDYRSGLNVLSDMSTTTPDFGLEKLRELAASLDPDPQLKYGKIAILTQEGLQYGLFRMMGAVSEAFDIYEEFQVFSDCSQARAWLGLPEELNLEI